MDALDRLRADLLASADPDLGEQNARVAVLAFEDAVHVEYIGSPFDQGYGLLCATIQQPDVAARLGSLILRSATDEGVNGTRNWDLARWLGGPDFPQLGTVRIEQNAPGQHNRVIVGDMYEEDGAIGRLLHKSPCLETLVVPSAPDASFFAGPPHPHLRYLDVDAGYDTQDFIARLAASSCFPALQTLAFGEYNETYLDDFLARCTPFEAYRQLFTSAAFRGVRVFEWRNPQCSDAQIQALSALRPARNFQFKIVTQASRYVPAPPATP